MAVRTGGYLRVALLLSFVTPWTASSLQGRGIASAHLAVERRVSRRGGWFAFWSVQIARFQGEGGHVTLSTFVVHVIALKKCHVSLIFQTNVRPVTPEAEGSPPIAQKCENCQPSRTDRIIAPQFPAYQSVALLTRAATPASGEPGRPSTSRLIISAMSRIGANSPRTKFPTQRP
jgi:hypothetical protein